MTSQHSQRWIAHFSGQATPWRTELAELVSDPAMAEPEVSDLVVRARKILSDLPGSIAPQE